MDVDRTKTLTELEHKDWGPPTYDSYLVRTCHALRDKPLGEFTTEDLRIMLGQKIGVAYLVPLAIEVLSADPFASGAHYRGDLLNAFLGLGPELWSTDAPVFFMARAIASLAQRRMGAPPSDGDDRDDGEDDRLTEVEVNVIGEALARFEADTRALLG